MTPPPRMLAQNKLAHSLACTLKVCIYSQPQLCLEKLHAFYNMQFHVAMFTLEKEIIIIMIITMFHQDMTKHKTPC